MQGLRGKKNRLDTMLVLTLCMGADKRTIFLSELPALFFAGPATPRSASTRPLRRSYLEGAVGHAAARLLLLAGPPFGCCARLSGAASCGILPRRVLFGRSSEHLQELSHQVSSDQRLKSPSMSAGGVHPGKKSARDALGSYNYTATTFAPLTSFTAKY